MYMRYDNKSYTQFYDEKNIRSLVVRLLNALKSFYTFRDLELMLDVPQQALWRYVNFLTVPEESTAKKILRKIEELRLIEKVVDDMVRPNSKGQVEVWRLTHNIGFLDLLGFWVTLIPKIDDVDVILAYPEDSSPLATSIAYWIRVNLCVATRKANATFSSKYVVETYQSEVDGSVEYLAIPKGCIDKEDYVLMVTNNLNDVNMFNAVYALVRKVQAVPWGLIAVVARNREVVDSVRTYGLNVIKVLRVIT